MNVNEDLHRNLFRFVTFRFILSISAFRSDWQAELCKAFENSDVNLLFDENKKFKFEIEKILFQKHRGVGEVRVEDDTLVIISKLSTEAIFKVIIIVFLLFAFFSTFSVKAFLIFASAFSLSYFSLVYFLVRNHFFRILMPFLENDDKKGELSDMQKEWIKNKNLCSACGTELNKYHSVCPECGLHIAKKKVFSRFNTTANSLDMKYEYKGKTRKIASHFFYQKDFGFRKYPTVHINDDDEIVKIETKESFVESHGVEFYGGILCLPFVSLPLKGERGKDYIYCKDLKQLDECLQEDNLSPEYIVVSIADDVIIDAILNDSYYLSSKRMICTDTGNLSESEIIGSVVRYAKKNISFLPLLNSLSHDNLQLRKKIKPGREASQNEGLFLIEGVDYKTMSAAEAFRIKRLV